MSVPLPIERTWPYEYKAPFAPSDVIEEYTRPARFRENGEIVFKEALSEPELLDFPGVGTLEAFNTDGCRSLLRTVDAPYVRERRWHASQTHVDRKDGGVVLSLDVCNDWALRSWILSFGPLARVLRPAALAAQIKDEILRASQRYDME